MNSNMTEVQTKRPLLKTKNMTQIIDDVWETTWNNFQHPQQNQIYVIAMELKNQTNRLVDIQNANQSPTNKIKPSKNLEPWLAAMLISHLYPVRKLSADKNDPSADTILIIYDSNTGLYRMDDDFLSGIIRKCDKRYSTNDKLQVIDQLRDIASVTEACRDPIRTPVANGIYNRQTKTLEPFDPKFVFTTKCPIAYNPNATNPKILMNDQTTWDIESWIDDLFDHDKELIQLSWEIIHALLWPTKQWNKSIWFLSELGNNGKGTFCQLLKNLCGKYASIQLSDMSSPYGLSEILNAYAIISDENDCDVYIDKLANFKALVTGDSIQINRKYKNPITFAFHGLVVQCINSMPKLKDKSDSALRRLLIIPFKKWFNGCEKTEIKSDYLNRQDVLEYTLKKAIEMDIEAFSNPKACVELLKEYKNYNDPVTEFWEELEEEFQWNLLPINFIYSLFVKWFTKTHPSSKIPSKNKVSRSLTNLLANNPNWRMSEQPVWVGDKMDKFEPLILEYDLTDYRSSTYMGKDPSKICDFKKKPYYRGIVRLSPSTTNTNNNVKTVSNDDYRITHTTPTCQEKTISKINYYHPYDQNQGIPFTDPEQPQQQQ